MPSTARTTRPGPSTSGPAAATREQGRLHPGKSRSPREGRTLIFLLKQNHGGWNSDDLLGNNLGRFRLSYTTSPDPVVDPLPQAVREILSIPREQRTPAQINDLLQLLAHDRPEFKEANAKIEELAKQHPEGARQMVLEPAARARDEPPQARRLAEARQGGQPGVPAVLNPLPADAPPTRLTFARWLVDPKSPTTARAFVNRVWQAYFGTGLVATSEDLGTQSEAPSHPELLDWLAVEFMEHGWKQKHLHRLIVTSATYRQIAHRAGELREGSIQSAARARPALPRRGRDRARHPACRQRAAQPEVGGRSVMPPAPDFLFKPPASYAPFPWVEETGDDRYRRALYTYRRRTTPFPMLQTFDAPEGTIACVRRTRSNTPLQALTLLNETVSMEAARAFALTIVDEGGKTDAERLTYAFRRALSRPPTDREEQILIQLMEKQKARVAEGWINTHALSTGKDGLPKLPEGVTPATLAAYTVAARALLNLDETITKQ